MYKLFEKVPVIEGDRIILKRIEFEDADLLDELSKDSDIYRFLPTYLLEQEIDDKKELIDILYTKCLEEKSSLFLGSIFVMLRMRQVQRVRMMQVLKPERM